MMMTPFSLLRPTEVESEVACTPTRMRHMRDVHRFEQFRFVLHNLQTSLGGGGERGGGGFRS